MHGWVQPRILQRQTTICSLFLSAVAKRFAPNICFRTLAATPVFTSTDSHSVQGFLQLTRRHPGTATRHFRGVFSVGLALAVGGCSSTQGPEQPTDGASSSTGTTSSSSVGPGVGSSSSGVDSVSPTTGTNTSHTQTATSTGTSSSATSSSTQTGASSTASGTTTSDDTTTSEASTSGEVSATSAATTSSNDTSSASSDTTSNVTGPIEQPSDPCAPRAGYRNIFGELLGKTKAEVDAKVDASFQQLFHGGEDETVYYESGADQAYIFDVNNQDIRSEGMSYGMTISVLLDHRDEFDRLWRWARQRMYESSGQYAGYFSWSMTPDGQITGGPSAPDGEEYFATALILASKKWGDGEGIFNYGQEARNLLSALTSKGNFNAQEHLVKFVPTSNYSDPSYVLPAFYELWACFDPATKDFWKSAATKGREFLQKTTHATTGLAPYLANFDGSPYSGGGNFNSDSWRVVGNIMMDHHLFGVDPWQPTFAEKYAAFFQEHQIQPQEAMAYEFTLTGEPQARGDNVIEGLVAQNAFIAFGTSAEIATPYVQQLWDLAVPTGVYRYYDGMLYLFGLLHLSGNFRLE